MEVDFKALRSASQNAGGVTFEGPVVSDDEIDLVETEVYIPPVSNDDQVVVVLPRELFYTLANLVQVESISGGCYSDEEYEALRAIDDHLDTVRGAVNQIKDGQ